MRIICNECNGNGFIRIPDNTQDTTVVFCREVTCDKCNGEGWIEIMNDISTAGSYISINIVERL